MPDFLKRAGKKISESLWKSVEAWLWPMVGASLIGALAALIVYFRGSHPRLLSALLGALIALIFSTALPLTIVIVKMVRDRRTGKPNRAERQRVAEILIADKTTIKDLVMVCGIQYREIAKGREPAHLDFAFGILNMSLYSVSVESIDGHINFHIDGEMYTPRLPPRIETKTNEARNLSFRRTGYFVIQQPFETEMERDYLLNASPNSYFYFNALKITLTGADLKSTELKTDMSFSKKDGQWLAHYEGYFVHAGLGDQKLAFDRRVKNIEKLSRVYGRGEQLLLAFNNDRPSVGSLKQWAEMLRKVLYECYGLSGESKFDDNRGYNVEVPEAESEHSNWLYATWQRLEDLIQEERPQSAKVPKENIPDDAYRS